MCSLTLLCQDSLMSYIITFSVYLLFVESEKVGKEENDANGLTNLETFIKGFLGQNVDTRNFVISKRFWVTFSLKYCPEVSLEISTYCRSNSEGEGMCHCYWTLHASQRSSAAHFCNPKPLKLFQL